MSVLYETKPIVPLDQQTWRGIDRFERELKPAVTPGTDKVTMPTTDYRALVGEVRRLRAIVSAGLRRDDLSETETT